MPMIIKKYFLLIVCSIIPYIANAQYYSGEVGEYISLPEPSLSGGYEIYNCNFYSTSDYLDVAVGTNRVKILKEFSGYETVCCDYYCVRQYTVAGHVYEDYKNGTEYYMISCSSSGGSSGGGSGGGNSGGGSGGGDVGDTGQKIKINAYPSGGTITRGTKVKLTASQKSAIIEYTIDGSDPRNSSTSKTISNGSSISIRKSCTLKAYAMYLGTSKIYTFKYTVPQKYESVAIDEAHFPDEAFRAYVSQYGENGILNRKKIEYLENVYLENKGIKDLKGIEYFSEMKKLFCSHNELTSLDLSENSELEILTCYDNKISKINVSGNDLLKDIYMPKNNLESIDISNCPALIQLVISDNPIKNLDISRNTKIEELDCQKTEIDNLDLTRNKNLKTLICNDCSLTNIYLPKNSQLEKLYCYRNKINKLDISGLKHLSDFICSKNELSSLDFSNCINIVKVDAESNNLSTLDLSNCKNIETIDVGSNKLSTLDLSNKSKLKELYCSNNILSSLNVSGCSNLTYISCYNNRISGSNMDDLISGLSYNWDSSNEYNIYIFDSSNDNEENVCTKEQVNKLKQRGWTPYYYHRSKWGDYNTWDIYEGSETSVIQPHFIENNKKYSIFNMNGVKLSTPHKGINIINGKKIYIK